MLKLMAVIDQVEVNNEGVRRIFFSFKQAAQDVAQGIETPNIVYVKG